MERSIGPGPGQSGGCTPGLWSANRGACCTLEVGPDCGADAKGKGSGMLILIVVLSLSVAGAPRVRVGGVSQGRKIVRPPEANAQGH
jgi:hypothetical protein